MSEGPIQALAGFTIKPDGSMTVSLLVDGQIGEVEIPKDQVLRLRDLLNTIEEE